MLQTSNSHYKQVECYYQRQWPIPVRIRIKTALNGCKKVLFDETLQKWEQISDENDIAKSRLHFSILKVIVADATQNYDEASTLAD